MQNFNLFLEIAHEFRPTLQQAQKLIDLLQTRLQNQCSKTEFETLLAEFIKMAHSQKSLKIMSFTEFQTIITPIMKISQLQQLLIDYLLRDIPPPILILYNQFLDLLHPDFVSTDEVSIIIMSLLSQHELKSAKQLYELATQTLTDLRCINGLVPRSKFIIYLHSFDLDEDSVKQNIQTLETLLDSYPTFNQMLNKFIKNPESLKVIKNNPQVYQLRFGAEPSQLLVEQIVKLTAGSTDQKNQLQQQLIALFIEYEKNFSKHQLVPKQVVPEVETVKISQEDGEHPGFDIDSLVLAAEWETVDLKSKIETKLTVNNDQDDDDSDLSYNGQLSNYQSSLETKKETTLGASAQKYTKVISHKDDDVMKKLKKVLNGMK